MSRRTKIAGTRPIVTWLLATIVLVLVVGLGAGVFIVYPQYQERQAAQATVEQVETHYQAGVAFQSVGDWEKAAGEYERVIQVKPNYKDVQTRLAEVKAKQAEAQAQATAVAVARVTEVAVQTRATATAQAQATAVAQVAGATATADAVEAHYQKGLAYINLGKWDEAKAELEQVFTADPNYKEVQVKLAEVEAKLAEVQELTPTAIPPPTLTPQPATQSEGPPWWDASYSSRQQLTVGNNADTPLPAGYSVKLTLTGEKATDFFRQSSSAQPGDDVQIVHWDESEWTEVDRYVESFASAEIQIWFVTQDEIPTNGVSRSYWVYFGDAAATEPPADVNKVFLWWDDFHLNTVGKYTVFRSGLKGNWHKGAISYDEAGERVSVTTGDNINVLVQPPISGGNLLIEGDLYFTKKFPESGEYSAFVRVIDTNNHYTVLFPVSHYDAMIRKVDGGRSVDIANAGKLTYPLDTWHHITMGAYEDRIEAWMDGTQITAIDATFKEGGVGLSVLQANGYIDNIRVRKYVSPEPSVFLSAEAQNQ